MTKAKYVPEMREALEAIKPHLPIIRQALEEAIISAKSILEDEGIEFEVGLHASLVRAYFLKHFQEPGQQKPWQFKRLNNNGVQMEIGNWMIRARKSVKGAIPQPKTRLFEEYVRQMTLGGEFDQIHNLLLLWETNSKGEFQRLSLIYPLSESVVKWRFVVQHPLRTGLSIPNQAPAAASQPSQPELVEELQLINQEDMMFGELDDLEIELVGEVYTQDVELALKEKVSEQGKEEAG